MIEAFLDLPLVNAVSRLVGLTLLAATATMVVGFVYTSRAKTSFPDGPTVLVGLGSVALYLNTRIVLSQFVGGESDVISLGTSVWTITTFLLAGIGSFVGRRLGETIARSERLSFAGFQPVLSPIVRATGRFITVELPDEIGDVEGYDDVPEETKAKLAGAHLDFPRGLTVSELRTQLVDRLKEKHQVGYVDVDLTEEGHVEHLAVARRAIGLGPALPPGSVATAIRADPPFSASPGDRIQVWRPSDGESGPERVGRAELRATANDTASVAAPRAVARKLDPDTTYRLVTLPTSPNVDREFASMLRRSDETMTTVEMTEASPLIGVSIRALDVTVIAIEAGDGTLEPLPRASRTIRPGDRLHAIGRPANLRVLAESRGAAEPGTDTPAA